ncbi:hypothetical protein HW555_007045 [Spodoptera exigua]|uniref:Uncharacterized protein n=1 Tax=Spodoptera exigua TaxID=7107 RepID=A0A835L4T9_SPOEX|nr:hypothetical protein HW555_007045 [Spodoptera exigua]
MTSEIEAIKTNEFLRRRKLRLQQVREQSKDIAKKIRQRAKVEKIRQVSDLDAKKQKEYFECQDKLVKQLQVLYTRGVENVGAGHQSASELTKQDELTKTDVSKLRGKEAVAILRRNKQEKLDQQKKLLDRKLQAREAANEISRDKSSLVANKLLSKFSKVQDCNDLHSKAGGSSELLSSKYDNKVAGKTDNETEPVKTSDMATQWDLETIPHEWEPAVPELSIPTDKDSPNDFDDNGNKAEKNKILDLFAVSEEMPSSLRGNNLLDTREREPGRPSLTIISEYLQNRKMRLRETEPSNINKKPSDDMQSLRQTILRTRTTKPEGSHFNACQVLDEQIVPVPTWRAERRCQFCSHKVHYTTPAQSSTVQKQSRQYKSVTTSRINQIFTSINPMQQADIVPSPVLRHTSPFRRRRTGPGICSNKGACSSDKMKTSQEACGLQRKSSVVMYNHSTRDTRDLPYGDDKLVVRDLQAAEDAYSQAMKEAAVDAKSKEQNKKQQELRNKVAVTKQNVEKEYKDTMNFLNSLPKDKQSKPIKNAYMDEHRQQMQYETRQLRMQQEYKKIQKECKKHHCQKNRNLSKSPVGRDLDVNYANRDFQYSWMPVPESDGNLAIHAIPNSVKSAKQGNSVKFSTMDSYHEYRSRHKHTPPTKDTNQDSAPKKSVIEREDSEYSDSSSISSDTSSVENLKIGPKKRRKNAKEINKDLSDAERIIIYKVLDSKSDKKTKRQTKLLNEIAKSLSCIGKTQKICDEESQQYKKVVSEEGPSKSIENGISLEQLHEGVYKMVEEQGDNIASMYFNDDQESNKVPETQSKTENIANEPCCCRSTNKPLQTDKVTPHFDSGDSHEPRQKSNENRDLSPGLTKKQPNKPSSISTCSYNTAMNDKANTSEGGYIKLIDETGQDAGKVFIGPSGFLNNNAYEVVIQLRKKDGTIEEKILDKDAFFANKQAASETNSTSEGKNISNKSNTDVKDPQPASSEIIHDDCDYRSAANEHSTAVLLQPAVSSKTVLSEKSQAPTDKTEPLHHRTNTDADEEIFLIQSDTNKNMCDKGVHTQSTDDVKQDGMSRPATSTYTQTSLSSPLHRPMYYHMSSSTSTAYLSPPELILPKFLKPDCIMSEDEPLHTIELTAKEYCEEYTDCTCKKCMQARNIIVRKISVKPTHEIKTKYENKNIMTPPNSTITVPEIRRENVEIPKKKKPCKTSTTERSKCSHKTRTHVDPVKRHCHRNKRKTSVESVRSITTRTSTARTGMTSSSKHRCNPISTSRDKKSEKSNLNPIIRDYVNKLLALNRDGLKAVEVADQECSSVGTPASSIINVPYNIDKRKTSLLHTISLEQIKTLLKKQIVQEEFTKNFKHMQHSFVYSVANNKNSMKSLSRSVRRKPVHKVKSLNISRNLVKRRPTEGKSSKPVLQPPTDGNLKSRVDFHSPKKVRSKSSPTPRHVSNSEPISRCDDSESATKNSTGTEKSDDNCNKKAINNKCVRQHIKKLPSHRATLTDSTVDSISESTVDLQHYPNSADIPVSMSTQTTNIELNTDSNLMKLAEDKLHNMEKIADLTEKCTKRLSDLARVLQEVRKNKSLVYSQISSAESTDSQPDHKSEKSTVSPIIFDSNDIAKGEEIQSPDGINDPVEEKEKDIGNDIPSPEYMTILSDIPKPDKAQESKHVTKFTEATEAFDSALHILSTNSSELSVKNRPKPPPALSRLSFKHGQDFVIPHELSTVIEVDSPMSVKHKTHSARNNDKETSNNNSNRSSVGDITAVEDHRKNRSKRGSIMNPDLLQTNLQLSNKYKLSSAESSDESKFQMIDLKQFNEIMLEPFISIQEYAKQYNMEPPDEGSNLEEIHREDPVNDDISSLHSDGSLPDVIAELLKRNVITEPFKFDTASNVNSTTISSESTLSMLALSKARRSRKKPSAISKNKENIGETSDTLSISSNPDLENAFKKLGMGWASSTLKKTKERLALSSSSNTSSSSLSQFKMKSFNQDIPVLVTDSVSSVVNVSKGVQNMSAVDYSKNAEQQTTLSNSMTVKEFLRKELAKKITFTNKSNVNGSQEFVSLFETKMPEEMKENSQVNRDEHSIDSAPSGANRARTSTPVQLFKSMTYHSSSSSNVSNGLFSNVDDLSSVKMTSNSMKNHSTSDKDDLTIPNFSLRLKKSSDCSKSD